MSFPSLRHHITNLSPPFSCCLQVPSSVPLIHLHLSVARCPSKVPLLLCPSSCWGWTVTQISTFSIKGTQHTNTVCNHRLIELKLTAVIRASTSESCYLLFISSKPRALSRRESIHGVTHCHCSWGALTHIGSDPKSTLQILTLPQCVQSFILSLIQSAAFFFFFLVFCHKFSLINKPQSIAW